MPCPLKPGRIYQLKHGPRQGHQYVVLANNARGVRILHATGAGRFELLTFGPKHTAFAAQDFMEIPATGLPFGAYP